MIFIYTTIATREEAKSLSNKLVRANLAACVNYWPLASAYEWKGKVQQEKEYALLVKTTKKRCKEAMKFIRLHHSYELPTIVAIPITDFFVDYKKWVVKSTTLHA